MRRCRSRRILSSMGLALLLAPPCLFTAFAYAEPGTVPNAGAEQSGPEFALRGQREVRAIKYGDWQKFCFKTPGNARVCRTTISGKWETGQIAVRVDLIEREGEDAARLQLFLPVGLYLQAGAKVTIDQGQPVQIPYVWCLTNTCIAANRADPALIRQIEAGQELKLEVADTNLLSVSTIIPLSQFASARASAPNQVITQEVDE